MAGNYPKDTIKPTSTPYCSGVLLDRCELPTGSILEQQLLADMLRGERFEMNLDDDDDELPFDS